MQRNKKNFCRFLKSDKNKIIQVGHAIPSFVVVVQTRWRMEYGMGSIKIVLAVSTLQTYQHQSLYKNYNLLLTGKDTTDFFDRAKNAVDVEIHLCLQMQRDSLTEMNKVHIKNGPLIFFFLFYTCITFDIHQPHSSCDFERYDDYYDDAKKNYDATSTTATATYMTWHQLT